MAEQDYIERLIIKNLAGEESAIERQELKHLLENDENIRKQFIEIRDVWNISNSKEFDSAKAFSKFKQRITTNQNKVRTRRITWYKYAGVAASLIIMLVVGRYISTDNEPLPKYYSYKTQPGERKLATLPDSSKIWLNGNTSLSFSSDFNKTERKVIFNGEAFFDVEHNTSLPFKVESGGHTITVLGTRFNVKANELVVETVLEDGRVQIDVKSDNQQCQLSPGQKSEFDIQSKRLKKMEEPDFEVYSAITRGQLVFKDEKLSDLAPRLEVWYGIHLKLNDEVRNLRFTGTIEKESIDDVLRIMAMSNTIKYTKVNKTITITQN